MPSISMHASLHVNHDCGSDSVAVAAAVALSGLLHWRSIVNFITRASKIVGCGVLFIFNAERAQPLTAIQR